MGFCCCFNDIKWFENEELPKRHVLKYDDTFSKATVVDLYSEKTA